MINSVLKMRTNVISLKQNPTNTCTETIECIFPSMLEHLRCSHMTLAIGRSDWVRYLTSRRPSNSRPKRLFLECKSQIVGIEENRMSGARREYCTIFSELPRWARIARYKFFKRSEAIERENSRFYVYLHRLLLTF